MIHRLQAAYLHLFIDTYPRTGGKDMVANEGDWGRKRSEKINRHLSIMSSNF